MTKTRLYITLSHPLPLRSYLFLKIQKFSLVSLYSIKLVIDLLHRTQSAMKEMHFSLGPKWLGLDSSNEVIIRN